LVRKLAVVEKQKIVNQRLSLLPRIKHLLAYYARPLYYRSLVLPILDYADMVWYDKDNAAIMNSLQVLQNKAAKLVLDRPLYSSATDALKSFCLRDWGRLGNEGRPISLKIVTQSRHVDLCNMPKFQVRRISFSRVLDISPSGVLRG